MSPTTKIEKAVFITAFSILKNEVSGCEHARERVRQQAKGARGCAGERKRMSTVGRERKRRTISLPRESVFDKEAWRDGSIAI